jgi:hypothetical protein
MNPPSTPLEAVKLLGELTGQLRDQVRAYGQAVQDVAAKRHAADQVEARAFLRAEGGAELRKNQAKVDADTAEQDAKVAEALVKVLWARIDVIKIEIECTRTASATLRAELSTLAYSGEGA